MPVVDRWSNGRAVYVPEQLWNDGQMIANWVNSLSRTTTNEVRDAAPSNKRPNRSSDAPATTLKQSIRTTGQRRLAPEMRKFEISMHGYGKWVNGPKAPIIIGRGGKMGLPVNPPPYFSPRTPVRGERQWLAFVRGDTPASVKNIGFIERGWDVASARHSALRGNLAIRHF